MTNTAPITYLYEVTGADGAAHEVAITRQHIGRTDSYTRGSSGTEVFTWNYAIDGGPSHGTPGTQRAIAYEYARAELLGIHYVNVPHLGPLRGYVNVRNFQTVAAEMKANYRSQNRS